MLGKSVGSGCAAAGNRRRGVAAAEFAVCLPIFFVVMYGMWEVGRMTEVQNVVWNSAREGARDASMGQVNLSRRRQQCSPLPAKRRADSLSAGPFDFHDCSRRHPAREHLRLHLLGLTANRELFTFTFTDITTNTVTDPTAMAQLDHYQIGVQVPYASIGWVPAKITSRTRLYVTVDWASLVDSPFQIAPYLPAQ